jgi:hypothetical protein
VAGLGVPGRGHDPPDHVPDELFVDPRLPGSLSGTADDPGLPDRIQDGATHPFLDLAHLEDEIPPEAYEPDQFTVELLEAGSEGSEASLEVVGPGIGVLGPGIGPVGAGMVSIAPRGGFFGIQRAGGHAALMKV